VVGYGRYRIVGDNMVHNSQETILMARTADFVVKTMKQKLKVDNTLPYYYDVFASFVFIKLSESSLGEDSTPLASFIDGIAKKHYLIYCLFVIRAIHPCGEYSIYCLKCLCVMVLLEQTLNEL